jgi:hypothetical protein
MIDFLISNIHEISSVVTILTVILGALWFGYSKLHADIVGLSERIDKTNHRLDQHITASTDRLDQHITASNARMDSFNARMDSFNARMDEMCKIMMAHILKEK